MSMFEIPLIAAPQTLSVSFGGTIYDLTVKWNEASQCWVLDIADVSGVPILSGIPLVAGVDLLEQYEYLNFGGQLIAGNDTDAGPPTFANLGTTGHLYFVPT